MVSPCGGTPERSFSDGGDCGTDCFNCGCHNYDDALFLCKDCEKVKLTNACQKAIRAYLRKYGIPKPPYYSFYITKSVIKIIKGLGQ